MSQKYSLNLPTDTISSILRLTFSYFNVSEIGMCFTIIIGKKIFSGSSNNGVFKDDYVLDSLKYNNKQSVNISVK